MKPREIVLVGMALTWVSIALADTLILKDQRKFTGKIIRVTDVEVVIETPEGAAMTFPRANVATMDRPQPPTTATAPVSGPVGLGDLQREVAALRAEVEAIKEANKKLVKDFGNIKEMKEKLDKLTGEVTDVSTRAARLPVKRGDFAGSKDRSKFKFGRCSVDRAGDEYMVHGFIKNIGTSPGVWVRIITELQDDNGRVLKKNDINPTFTPSGSHETRDKSVLSPGEEFEFYSYVPYGDWASSKYTMGVEDDVAPPKGADPSTIADKITLDLPRSAKGEVLVLKLEIPPKEGEMDEGPGAKKKAPERGRK